MSEKWEVADLTTIRVYMTHLEKHQAIIQWLSGAEIAKNWSGVTAPFLPSATVNPFEGAPLEDPLISYGGYK